MPTVPLYQPQVKEQPLPNAKFAVEAPAEAFGVGGTAAGIGQAVRGVAGDVEKYALKEKEKADDMAVLDAGYRAARLKNELMYGKQGAIGLKGLDAAQAAEKYIPDFAKGMDEISSNLSADQRAKFQHIRNTHQVDLEGDLNRHATNERNVYYEGVLKNGVSQAQDDALLRWNQPSSRINPTTGTQETTPWNQDYIKKKIAEQDAYIVAHADANGRVSPEEVKNQMAISHSQTHQKVIQSIIDSQLPNKDTLAKQYLAANKDDIRDGETLDKVTKAVEEATLLGESQKNARELYRASGNDYGIASAKAEEKLKDQPKLLQETQRQIQRLVEIERNASESRRNKVFNPAYEKVTKGTDPNELTQAEKDALHPDDKEKLRRIYDANKEKTLEKNGEPIWYKVRRELADPVNGFEYASKLSLLKDYADKMSKQQLEDLAKYQSTVLNHSDRKELDTIWGRSRAVEDSLQSLHITDEPGQAYVRREVETWFAAEARRNGKQPTSEEVAKRAGFEARQALKAHRVHQTFPKPPKAPDYNTPDNVKIVSGRVAAAYANKKIPEGVSKQVDGAMSKAWETVYEQTGKPMTPDQLRKNADIMLGKYTVEKRATFGVDWLAKDTEKFGYQIEIGDVPNATKDRISAALKAKGQPVNDRSIVWGYIQGLAANRAKQGAK